MIGVKHYLFPFDAIKKGSRIVLYGAGDVGISYHRQLRDTGFCTIVLWLDKKFDGKTTLAPEEIKSFPTDQYDFVVIAIKSRELTKNIKKFLLKQGVSEYKVIDVPPLQSESRGFPILIDSGLSLNDFLYHTYKVRNALTDYFRKSDGNIEYFNLLIEEIRQAGSNHIHELVQRKAIEIIDEDMLFPEAKIVLLRILYEAECFSSEHLQRLIILIGQIKGNTPQKYWLLTDLSFLWLYYPKVLYDEFFIDKKKLMRNYAEELSLTWNPPLYKGKGNRNICILCYVLFEECITQTIPSLAGELKKRGYTVHIIGMIPYIFDNGTNFLKPKYYSNSDPVVLSTGERSSLYPNDVQLHYFSAPTMKDRQQKILDFINQINPYCILDVTDDFSAISYYYSASYPVIYITLRKLGFSSSFFHKMIINIDSKTHPPVQPEQALYMPFYREIKKPKKVFLRSDYGFSSDDILVVTVGSRLGHDLCHDLIDQFCVTLLMENKIKWLNVGVDDLPYLQENYTKLIGKQVFLWGYEEDLPGLYGMCDIYLNPARVGGGTTIVWAMQQGIAVVSPRDASAGFALIGEKLSVKTEKELVPYVLAMSREPDLLKKNRDAILEITSKWVNVETYVDKLIEGMENLSREFLNKRLNGKL